MMKDVKEIKPESLILNDLELKPYQYKEFLGADKSLMIDARIVLTEDQYAEIGRFKKYVMVVRKNIDEKPREMNFFEAAWSREGDEIKEQITLFDRKEREKISPFGPWLKNLKILAIKQSLIIEDLSNILVSKGIIDEEKIKEIVTNITEERIRDKDRELNRLPRDLDEFKSLER